MHLSHTPTTSPKIKFESQGVVVVGWGYVHVSHTPHPTPQIKFKYKGVLVVGGMYMHHIPPPLRSSLSFRGWWWWGVSKKWEKIFTDLKLKVEHKMSVVLT